MTDSELLEKAARAAGFGSPDGGVIWTESEYPRGSGKHGALWNFQGYMDTAELWNPLTDDGDALRLAVKLRLRVEQATTYSVAFAGSCMAEMFSERVGDDPYASTRRAIVRAAASLAATPAPKE